MHTCQKVHAKIRKMHICQKVTGSICAKIAKNLCVIEFREVRKWNYKTQKEISNREESERNADNLPLGTLI